MKKWYVKILIVILSIVISFFTLLLAVDVNFLWLFGNSPSVDEIGKGILPEASVIYSADNKVIGKFFSENRNKIKYEDLTAELINTLVSTED